MSAAVLGVALVAVGQPRTARLEYERGPGAQRCPDEQEVQNAVAVRLGYSPFVADAGMALRASVEKRDGRLSGRLEKALPDGGISSRTLTSGSGDCAELISALTLAVSIAIDEQVLSRPSRSHGEAVEAPELGAGSEPNADFLELFLDRDAWFVRAGSKGGLAVGQTLDVVHGKEPSSERLGRASVMEVWEGLARVNLDPGVTAQHRQGLFLRIERPKNQLKGSASAVGVGDLRRVTVMNLSARAWSACEVWVPGNRRYRMDRLGARESEGIMFFRFHAAPPPAGVVPSGVYVRCKEGEAQFPLEW